MNSETRKDYSSLFDEDWVKLGYLADQELTGSIHPLFQRTNKSRPLGHEHIWPQYKSEAEYNELYKVMGPVLQLATRILGTPSSLDFLYQVAYSPRITSRGERSNQGRSCKEFGWIEPPTKELGRQMTREALSRLSRSITFLFGDSKANPDIKNAFAVTGPWILGFQDGVKINDASSTAGMASRVTLNLEKLGGLDAQGDNTPQKMTLQLKIAITLCHETAHALAFAVDSEMLRIAQAELDTFQEAESEGRLYRWGPIETDEPFYRDERMAEIGNSWENQVFGGKIHWSGIMNDPLFVSKWPTFFTAHDNYPTRGKEKATDRKYILSLHYVRNVHRQGFWDNVVPGDASVLYVKRTIGIEYVNPDTEALSIDSSQINWPGEWGTGRVDRERDGRPLPDPSASRANETEDERYAREQASEPRV